MVENGNKDEDLWNTSYHDLYDLKPDYSGLSKEFRESEKLNDDPYWENNKFSKKYSKKSSHSVQTHEHKDSDWVMRQHREESVRSRKRKKGQNPPTRLKICAFSMLAAIVCAVSSYYLIQWKWQRSLEQVKIFDYSQQEVSDSFFYNDNNEVFLEEYAYTIVSGEQVPYFPLGQKLIGVYVKVESSEYVREGNALINVYVGYETSAGKSYVQPETRSSTWEYLEESGFREEHYLSAYGIGNGRDEAGYFWFFVPEETKQITFYMEQREEGERYGALKKVYYSEMTVLPEDEDIVNQLADREAGRL